MPLAEIYKCYVIKIEKKDRTKSELNEVLSWLTGLNKKELATFVRSKITLDDFFAKTKLHPNVSLITGTICGVRIEEIQDPLMKKIRYMDKVVDELARGRDVVKIKRN